MDVVVVVVVDTGLFACIIHKNVSNSKWNVVDVVDVVDTGCKLEGSASSIQVSGV